MSIYFQGIYLTVDSNKWTSIVDAPVLVIDSSIDALQSR